MGTLSTRKLIWLTACGLYGVAMFVGTHVPLKMHDLGARNFDKLLHLSGYFGLGLLVAWGLCLRQSRKPRLWTVYLAILIWACLDEITQPLVGRTADFYDWLADAIGCGVGMFAAAVVATAVRTFSALPPRSASKGV